jgi:ribosomal protein S18 acetylase RimI-like enzyme
MDLIIKRITNNYDQVVSVIRDSFITVAQDFNITKENAPTNPAFIEQEAILKMTKNGIEMYGLYEDYRLVGFVALEKANEEVYWLEKLAILPEFRHKGYGKALIDFIINRVIAIGGKKISIGIINENKILKQWYQRNGFIEIGTRVFQHLPFEVCFMELTL